MAAELLLPQPGAVRSRDEGPTGRTKTAATAASRGLHLPCYQTTASAREEYESPGPTEKGPGVGGVGWGGQHQVRKASIWAARKF